jgi:hypothetical protein
MKLFLFIIGLIHGLVQVTSLHSHDYTFLLKTKRFVTQRIGYAYSKQFEHLRQNYLEQRLKMEKEEEKRKKIYRDYLAKRIKSSFIRDFLAWRY